MNRAQKQWMWLGLHGLLVAWLLFGDAIEWINQKPERAIIGLILISWFSINDRLKNIETSLLNLDLKVPEPKPSLEYLDALESKGMIKGAGE